MPEGIYAAAAGMAAQQAQIDAVANDIANVNTTGYHSQRIGFRDLVYTAEQNVPVGAGTAAIDLGRTEAQGVLNQTGNPLSLAIAGPGYFQVRQADGSIALTRNGDFSTDANGSMAPSSGQRLVPPITLPKGADPSDVKVAANGAVTLKGQTLGKLTIVDVNSEAGLRAAGDGLFVATAASGAAAPVASTSIEQGSLEASNVDMGSAMVAMIQAQRGYELASSAIKNQDELLNVANQLVK